jgi:hypothetical protein
MARRAPRVGDLFTVRGRDLVGRVVSTAAVVGPTHGCVLVYVYADARLSRDALLVPPLLTTRAPWSRGLFVFLRAGALLPGQARERHAFRDEHGRWLDEEGRPVSAPEEPSGEYRLFEVEGIEAMLAKAPGGYAVPPPDAGDPADYAPALRAIVTRWVTTFGRPPTRAEWQSLYDVAVGGDDEGEAS